MAWVVFREPGADDLQMNQFAARVVLVEREPRQQVIAAVGLYGDRLRVGCGSLGGWDSFGPERLVTRSRGNVLYDKPVEMAINEDDVVRIDRAMAAGFEATDEIYVPTWMTAAERPKPTPLPPGAIANSSADALFPERSARLARTFRCHR